MREDVPFLAEARPLLRHVHEHWDGTGGPDGLSGEAIPLGARVLHACLEYDALSPEGALDQLARDSGRRFDPRVLEALAGVLAEADARVEDQEALSDSR